MTSSITQLFSGDSLEEKEETNGRSSSQPPPSIELTEDREEEGESLTIPVPESSDKLSPTGIRHFLRTAAERHKGKFETPYILN
jgi:hypothetical protein